MHGLGRPKASAENRSLATQPHSVVLGGRSSKRQQDVPDPRPCFVHQPEGFLAAR